MSDLIERQAAIEAIAYSIELCNKALDSTTLGGRDRYAVEVERNSLLKLKDDFKLLPSAEPEPLSNAYMKAVWTWLLNYQIKAAELKGRYTPYEVLSWVANDWRKEHE